MKLNVTSKRDLQKNLLSEITEDRLSAKLLAHHELLKRTFNIEGSLVKCGIEAEDETDSFNLIRKLESLSPHKKVIVFDKLFRTLYLRNCNLEYEVEVSSKRPILEESLKSKGLTDKIQLITGFTEEAIPNFLIENPEFKISYLILNLNDYESTFNTLEFFYPRVVQGGIIAFNNYYRKGEDFKAVNDYFYNTVVKINSFSINKGPHFIVRK